MILWSSSSSCLALFDKLIQASCTKKGAETHCKHTGAPPIPNTNQLYHFSWTHRRSQPSAMTIGRPSKKTMSIRGCHEERQRQLHLQAHPKEGRRADKRCSHIFSLQFNPACFAYRLPSRYPSQSVHPRTQSNRWRCACSSRKKNGVNSCRWNHRNGCRHSFIWACCTSRPRRFTVSCWFSFRPIVELQQWKRDRDKVEGGVLVQYFAVGVLCCRDAEQPTMDDAKRPTVHSTAGAIPVKNPKGENEPGVFRTFSSPYF